MQAPATWLQVPAWGRTARCGFGALLARRDSAAPCMRDFHGNSSFHLPISWLAESPAVLCAETAKRGGCPPPSSRNAAPGIAGRAAWEQKASRNNMGCWEEGGRAERKDFLCWWEAVLPSACRKCTLASQRLRSQRATRVFHSPPRIAMSERREEKHAPAGMRNSPRTGQDGG